MRDDIAGGGKSNPADFARVGDRQGSFSGCGTVFPRENKRSKKQQRESRSSSSNDPLTAHALVHHNLSTRLTPSRNFPWALPPTKSIHASWRDRAVLFTLSTGRRNWLDANPRASKTLDTLAGDIQHDLGEEEIGDQHQDGRNDHGLRGGAADSLSAAAHAQALEATHRGEYETEYQRLNHALHDVRKLERVDGARPELDSTQAQGEGVYGVAAHAPDKISH